MNLALIQKSRKNIVLSTVLVLFLVVHIGIVSSIILQKHPIISPLHNDSSRIDRGADFYAVYHAGSNLRRGIDPYANNPDGVTPYWYPFRYLPIVAIAAQLLTFMTPLTAYIVWIIILEALLAVLLITLWGHINDWRVRSVVVGLLLISSPYFLELYMGQFTFASIALCCLAFMLPAGQPLFCASVLMKPFTTAALPALVRERRYWGHGVSAILCIILLSVPYFINHPDQGRVFISTNFFVTGGLDTGNYGFVRLLHLLASSYDVTIILKHWDRFIGILRFVLLAVTALIVLFARRKVIAVSIPALLLAHFLTYQHVWEHHMSGVCVLGAVLVTAPERQKWFTSAVLFSLLLLAMPTPFSVLYSTKNPRVLEPAMQWPSYASYLIVLPKVVPTIILFLSSVIYICHDGFISPSDTVCAEPNR